MSEAFNRYNRNGLRLESFARYAQNLFTHVTALQSAKLRKFKTVSEANTGVKARE